MAFVSKQSGTQSQDLAGAGEPLDFDPNDPTVVKVHYDVSTWTFDQRAELSEALADGDLPHYWDDDEVVVPELVEGQVDALFDRLEKLLGPFPIALAPDAESTEFGLDEWSDADRAVLTDALTESEVPYRWEGTTVVVAADAEHAVDDLLDAIEAGELLSADAQSTSAPPEGALTTVFVSVDKLAKDPMHAKSRTDLIELDGQLDEKHPPYGFAPRPWASAVEGVGKIVEVVMADATSTPHPDSSSEIIGLAQELRTLLRPYV